MIAHRANLKPEKISYVNPRRLTSLSMSNLPETPGFFKFFPEAIIPQRATPLSAGFDLHSRVDISITTSIAIPTGVGIVIPEGYYARIAPRSGLSLRGLAVNAGVIEQRLRWGNKSDTIQYLNLDYAITVLLP